MNCFSWNCRGAGNKPTVRELENLVRNNRASIVFLCETRQKSDRIRRLRNRLRLRGFAGIDSEGLSGGLALFWHESLFVEIKEVTERFIDVHIRVSPGEQLWHATFVYGEPRNENRHRMWSALCDLRADSSLPWLVAGDFNEALWQHEHLSSTRGQRARWRIFVIL
jgi:hypothetical protein